MSVKGDTSSSPRENAIPRKSKETDFEVLERVVATWQDGIEGGSKKKPSSSKPGTPALPASKRKGKPRQQKPVDTDPFSCSCGPCKRFWKENFSNISVLSEPVLKRAQKTSTMFRPEQSDWRIKKGDRVLVDGKVTGLVLFVGLLDENVIAPTVYVGVKCDDNIGSTHNGIMNGKRYFHCARGHGALVPYADVRPLNPPEAKPPVTGNSMFDSYQEVIKTRALRRQKMDMENEQSSVKASKPNESRLRTRVTVYDENDVAYKDAIRQQAKEEENMKRLRELLENEDDSQGSGGTQVYHYANTTVKVRTGGPVKQKIDPQARRFARWKEEFGGGERGEKLVSTLKKLHEGLNKGKQLKDEDGNELEFEETAQPPPTQTHPHSSKPPTRMSEHPTQSTR